MRFHVEYSAKNGLGKPAVSLYLAGCDKLEKCQGCHNPEFWEPVNKDTTIILPTVIATLAYFVNFHQPRLAILGGEPLAPWNIEITETVFEKVKEAFPDVENILYTWRSLKEVNKLIDTTFIDYGVLGSFDPSKFKPDTLPSSSNQVVWDFNNNTKLKAIKLY